LKEVKWRKTWGDLDVYEDMDSFYPKDGNVHELSCKDGK